MLISSIDSKESKRQMKRIQRRNSESAKEERGRRIMNECKEVSNLYLIQVLYSFALFPSHILIHLLAIFHSSPYSKFLIGFFLKYLTICIVINFVSQILGITCIYYFSLIDYFFNQFQSQVYIREHEEMAECSTQSTAIDYDYNEPRAKRPKL